MPRSDDALNISKWSTQLRKGLLDLCIVNIVRKGDIYGYDLVKQLASVRGLVVTEGTVYPLLSRLKGAGILKTRLEESANGPARKYYALTAEGQRVADQMNRHWVELMVGVDKLLGDEAPGK
jgi:PadR family transcriptional regulator PadR